MGPKQCASSSTECTTPKCKKMMSLEEKVEIINKLKEGMKTVAVVKKRNVNESAILQ